MEYHDNIREQLKTLKRHHPQLIHCSNILQKLNTETGEKKEAIENLAVKYIAYIDANFSLNGWSDEIICQRVALLNDYYEFYDKDPAGYNKLFSSQGKLRPTILEEFLYLLFRDVFQHIKRQYGDERSVLGIGGTPAYTNLYFSPSGLESFIKNPSFKINFKDQDFALYRTITFSIDGGDGNFSIQAKIPCFATEVKTYIDKTMLEGIIATAEKIKMGNPYTRFVVLSEHYEVDRSIDPSYSQIDQIYIIRKGAKRKLSGNTPVHADVILRYFHDAMEHIMRPWSDIDNKISGEGVVI